MDTDEPRRLFPISVRLIIWGIAGGIVASAWIVLVGGPSERLTRTWVFFLRCLTVGAVLSEIIAFWLRRKGEGSHPE